MRRVELIQGSEAWHAWRAGGIGGSACAAALGVVQPFSCNRVPTGTTTATGKVRRRWMTPEEVRYRAWERCTGRRGEEAANFGMRKGLSLEPQLRAAYERRTGLLMEPACFEAKPWNWLRVSLDGITFSGDTILEMKYQKEKYHTMALAGEVPEHYKPQVQLQLQVVEDAERYHFWSYNDSRELSEADRYALVKVERDMDYLQWMLVQLHAFWQCVTTDRYTPMEQEAVA